MRNRVASPELRAQIAADLRNGTSLPRISRARGVTGSVVASVALEHGIDLSGVTAAVTAGQTRALAAADWSAARRIELLNRLFDQAASLADAQNMTARVLGELARGVAVLIDKRRLEDDQPTERIEVVGAEQEARARVLAKLDELAEQRQKRQDQA